MSVLYNADGREIVSIDSQTTNNTARELLPRGTLSLTTWSGRERWNIDVDVDGAHTRLWQWRDSQIPRRWRSRPSPRNFILFDALASRRRLTAPISVR